MFTPFEKRIILAPVSGLTSHVIDLRQTAQKSGQADLGSVSVEHRSLGFSLCRPVAVSPGACAGSQLPGQRARAAQERLTAGNTSQIVAPPGS